MVIDQKIDTFGADFMQGSPRNGTWERLVRGEGHARQEVLTQLILLVEGGLFGFDADSVRFFQAGRLQGARWLVPQKEAQRQ